jgi:hypothetical protein
VWGSSDSTKWNPIFNGNITSTAMRLTDFAYIDSKLVMSWVYYTLLNIFLIQHGKWMWSYLDCTDVMFTSEISINKFEIHNCQLHLWYLFRQFAISLCINLSIRSYKFCCGIATFFVKRSSNASTLLRRTKTAPPHTPSRSRPWSSLKKSSLLMLKYSYWPKREFCLSEKAEFNVLKV